MMRLKLIAGTLAAVLLLAGISYSAEVTASASRITGVAPLSVFFTSDLTASSPTEHSFHEYDYTWSFGDPTSGTWGTNGKSKNSDKGAVASHVFEDAGTYTVTLTVLDSSSGDVVPGLAESFTITVTDQDTVFAGALTTCITDTTQNDFAGCPAGAAQVSTDDLTVVGGYATIGRRILFNRGSSWTTAEGSWGFSGNQGPVHLGAYGTCNTPNSQGICSNAPEITITPVSGKTRIIGLDSTNDWRVTDLSFIASTSETYGVIEGATNVRNFLALRVKATGFQASSIRFTHYRYSDSDIIKGNSVIESNLTSGIGNVLYFGGEDLTVLGNYIHDSETTHVTRIWQSYKGVISHNDIAGASWNDTAGRHALKLHGPDELHIGDFATTGANGLLYRTAYTVVSDNIFGGSGPWTVSAGPEDPLDAENLSDVIFEKNRFNAQYGEQNDTPVQTSIMIEGRYFTIRNNIADGTGGATTYRAIMIERRGIELTPLGNRIYNNTIYRSDTTANGPIGIAIDPLAEDTIVMNNYVSYPDGGTLIVDNSGTATTSNNVLTTTPYFLDPDNATPLSRDFHLTASSTEAIDQGYTVPLLDDFAGVSRSAPYDVGAYRYVQQRFSTGSMPNLN
ncbi:MAG: PKD domain-containing protein [Proteobacteria bacterium]|nr:PKD domain-containing protein [Pseudomonadota bacterium]